MSFRRITLPAVPPPRALVECTDCAKCCTYVAVDVNAPTTARYATDILWFLYHENVTMYVDGDGEWSVVFETRCRNLQDDKLCGIYPVRPHVCRNFDNKTCDVNDPENGRSFLSAGAFLEYLQAEKPRIYALVAAKNMPEPLRPAPVAKAARRPPSRPRTRAVRRPARTSRP